MMEAAAQLIEERDNQEVVKGASQETLAKLAGHEAANLGHRRSSKRIKTVLQATENKEDEIHVVRSTHAEELRNSQHSTWVPPRCQRTLRPLKDSKDELLVSVSSVSSKQMLSETGGVSRSDSQRDDVSELPELLHQEEMYRGVAPPTDLRDATALRQSSTTFHPCQTGVAERSHQALAQRVLATLAPSMSDWTVPGGGKTIILGRYIDDMFLLCEDGNVVMCPVNSRSC
jgi:hypothetical protein